MIIWLRHGQSTWNAAGKMQYDALHPELTDHGRTQAVEAAAALRERDVGAVWSSPAVRARQTAAILGDELGLPVQTSPLLVEQSRWEPVTDVTERIMRFTASLDAGTLTLAVTHGDTIDLASRLLTGSPVGIIPNAAWIETPLR